MSFVVNLGIGFRFVMATICGSLKAGSSGVSICSCGTHSGNRLRVNVQLVDAQNGSHLWAERLDRPVAELFAMQDEVVSRLANALSARLIAAEAGRAERSPLPDSLDLYFQTVDCFYRGMTPAHLSRARELLEMALTCDPSNIDALFDMQDEILARPAVSVRQRVPRSLAPAPFRDLYPVGINCLRALSRRVRC